MSARYLKRSRAIVCFFIGFAVFERPEKLIDWAVKETKVDKNKRSLKLIDELVNDYQPYAIVVEDYASKDSRCERRWP
jgi:hypothetical protein